MSGALFLLGCLLAAAPGAAGDAELDLQVRRLLRQLDAPQLAEREAAEQALLELGPDVLELLPRPDDQMPAETRQRLLRIVEQLQQALAQQAAEASWITLSGQQPLSQLLAAIERQSGNRLVDERARSGAPPPDPLLHVAFQHVPFWQALDEVLDRAGLSIDPFASREALHLVPRPALVAQRVGRAAYCGPLRIEPVAVVARRDLRDPLGNSLHLTLEVAWEPRLRPIALKQRLADVAAADQQGRPLEVLDPAAVLEAPALNMPQLDLTIPWKLPPRDATAIATLRGRLLAILPGRQQTFRFDNLLLARNVEQRAAGVSVVLERVVQNGRLWQVRIRVKFDEAGEALESHRGWILENEAYLEDAAGKTFSYDALETTQQTAESIGLAYGFVLDEPPETLRFVYKTPGAIIRASLEYRLEDIPLP